MWNCNEALDFGRRSIAINVLRLGWNPKASAPAAIAADILARPNAAAAGYPPGYGPAQRRRDRWRRRRGRTDRHASRVG